MGLKLTGNSKLTGNITLTSQSPKLMFTLDNPNAYGFSANDRFGVFVDISGNYAIVGADKEDDAGGLDSGKAYIYNVTTGALLHTLNNPNPYGTSATDWFGARVAISGERAIVSAYLEDAASNVNTGRAYIFDVVTGTLLHTLNNPNAYGTGANDNFGTSVGISGNYAFVGAYLEDDAGGVDSGKVYVFDVVTGQLLRTLDNPNAYGTSAGDAIAGIGVMSKTGPYAIIAANDEDDAGGVASGKAYIFDVVTGQLLRTLDNPNAFGTSAGDVFGSGVAMAGNYAIVGAYLEDDANGTNSGKAYIFDTVTGALLHTLDNPNAFGTSTDDNFGRSVAISDKWAAVGAWNEDDANGANSGKVYIFNVSTGQLVYTINNPNPSGTSVDDKFSGIALVIDGSNMIVGTFFEDDANGTNSGKVYIYQLP